MTDDAAAMTGQDAMHVLVLNGEGDAYLVPLEAMERHRAAPARQAAFVAPSRASGDAGIPANAPLYELRAEALAPYRLSTEERDAVPAHQQEVPDTRGFATGQGGQFIGVFPGWVAVARPVGGAAARRSNVHTYASAEWFNSGGGARSGAYPGLR